MTTIDPEIFKAGEFAYNSWDELASFTSSGGSTTYSYDPEGLRTKKDSGVNTTRYFCDDNDLVIAESNGGGQVSAQNIWGHKALARKIGGNYYYYLYNGHGDVMQVIDEAGNTVNSYSYDEWGNILTAQEQIVNPMKYAGEYYDEETGLYYLRARYYDPTIGRFISKDSYEGDITNPLTINLYTYCVNNPINKWDPTGHVVEKSENQYKYLSNMAVNDPDAGNRDWANDQLRKELYYHNTNVPGIYFNSATAYDATHGAERDPYFDAAIDVACGGIAGGIRVGTAKLSVSAIEGAGKAVAWGMWDDLAKVTYNGREYAEINGRYFVREAIDRMTPRGYGTAAGGYAARGITPSVVEDVITYGVSREVTRNGVVRTIFELNGVRVVTEKGGRIVITVMKY